MAAAVVVAGVLAFLYLERWGIAPAAGARQGARVTIVIEPGMSPPAIFRRLEAAGLVSDARMAGLYYRRHGDGTLKAGEYEFAADSSFREILRKIEAGDVALHPFTIPEGLTAEQIGGRLEELGICSSASYTQVTHDVSRISAYDPRAGDLEGYLFPSTYSFAKGVSPHEIVAKQIETFLSVYLPLRAKATPLLGFREAVVLASLVEEETGRDFERPLVASVFANRLGRRMLLQCDPTVIYAMAMNGTYDGNIRRSDLTMDSPYNTYRYPGLPPGPICNPGAAALEAALYPPPTEYLYFVAKNDGTHQFSADLSTHNRAVNRYQR